MMMLLMFQQMTVTICVSVSDVLCEPHSQLRIVHHNVQGLQSKWDDLSDWMAGSASSGNVFCFSETWVKPESVVAAHAWVSDILLAFSSAPGQSEKVSSGIMFVCP